MSFTLPLRPPALLGTNVLAVTVEWLKNSFFSATCRCVILEQSTKKTVLIMDCRNGRRRQLAVEYSFS